MNKKLIVLTIAATFLATACCWKNAQHSHAFSGAEANVAVADADMKVLLLKTTTEANMKNILGILTS